ncbi:MAG: folate family ECF transporter S component [Firmicutes bacterium]|nr:folate family ECF transporter S component [Bacillota bacterium]
MKKTKIITLAALFMALILIMRTFATFFLFGSTKFGFSFVPEALGSAILGPFIGGAVGGLSDIVGFLIKQDGTYFPGFTISSILKGLIYGLFLFKRPKSLRNIAAAILSAAVLVDLAINSIWINMLYGTKMSVVFLSKIATLPIYASLQIMIIYAMFKYLGKEIAKISE